MAAKGCRRAGRRPRSRRPRPRASRRRVTSRPHPPRNDRRRRTAPRQRPRSRRRQRRRPHAPRQRHNEPRPPRPRRRPPPRAPFRRPRHRRQSPASTSDDSTSGWWWLLLAAAVIVVGLLIWLLLSRRKKPIDERWRSQAEQLATDIDSVQHLLLAGVDPGGAIADDRWTSVLNRSQELRRLATNLAASASTAELRAAVSAPANALQSLELSADAARLRVVGAGDTARADGDRVAVATPRTARAVEPGRCHPSMRKSHPIRVITEGSIGAKLHAKGLGPALASSSEPSSSRQRRGPSSLSDCGVGSSPETVLFGVPRPRRPFSRNPTQIDTDLYRSEWDLGPRVEASGFLHGS